MIKIAFFYFAYLISDELTIMKINIVTVHLSDHSYQAYFPPIEAGAYPFSWLNLFMVISHC